MGKIIGKPFVSNKIYCCMRQSLNLSGFELISVEPGFFFGHQFLIDFIDIWYQIKSSIR